MKKILFFLLFAGNIQAQIAQTFTVLRLADRYGIETRQEESKVTLWPGIIEITEMGQTFREPILEQSKGTTYTRIITHSGCYTLLFDGPVLYAVHLRSNLGADRSYLNPKK